MTRCFDERNGIDIGHIRECRRRYCRHSRNRNRRYWFPPNFHVYFVCFPNTGFYTDPVPVTGYRRDSNFAVTTFSGENGDEQNKRNSPRMQNSKNKSNCIIIP